MLYYYFSASSAGSSDQCNVLSPSLCKVVNADAYTLLLGIWASLQLTWVSMLLFVQFLQVSRAMTTYENMFGIDHRSASALTSAFTSTGAPLDPNHPDVVPPSGAPGQSEHQAPGGHHGHKHGGGLLKSWGKLLGVDAFIETATGRGAAAGGKNKRRKKNPSSRGCITNCKDFWCDPSPVFGQREPGAAMLDGHVVNYTEMYESPALMTIGGRSMGGRRGVYEAVASEEV